MNYEQNIPFYITKFRDCPWKIYESDHYIFHVEAKSLAEKEIEKIKEIQESAYTKIIQTFKFQEPRQKIKYYFYPSQDKKAELMGDDWFAQAIYNEFEVHAVYDEKDRVIGEHEDTHLLSLPWGLSIGLFQEGLAEYMVGKNWFGEDHDKVAFEGLEENVLPTVSDMMEHEKWLNLSDEHAIYHYGFVGSFTKYLIENFGKEEFKELYQNTSRTKTKEENIKVFTKIYQISPEEMEEEWKNHISENSLKHYQHQRIDR